MAKFHSIKPRCITMKETISKLIQNRSEDKGTRVSVPSENCAERHNLLSTLSSRCKIFN